MQIALIADDVKKELMVQFCIAYDGIFRQHTLCATGITGKFVSEATSLPIHRFLSGQQGGIEQIASRIGCNEIDVVLLFRDPFAKDTTIRPKGDILRLCDAHNIPVATNIATAEVVIRSLERGDLAWREIVNPR